MRSKRSRARARRKRGTARGLSTRFDSAPLPGTITDRPSGMTPGGGGPGRPWRGWRMRLKDPGGSLPINSLVSTPTASSARACATAWSTTPPPNDQEYGTTIPTFMRARLPASSEQQAHDRARKQELRLDRDADAGAAGAPMEDHLPAHPEPRQDVLEVGHRRAGATDHRGVERAAPRSEQRERGETAADLEAPVGNVLVRHPVAGDVQRGPEDERKRPGPDDGSQRRARPDVQRHDHDPIMAGLSCVSVARGVPGRLVGVNQ